MRQPTIQETALLDHTHDGNALIDNGRFAFLMALAIDVMLFTGLMGGYLVLRGGSLSWPPPDAPPLNAGLIGASVLVLCFTSLFLRSTVRYQKRNQPANLKLSVVGALITLTLFLGLNAVEWTSLLRHGLELATVYGGIYFIITGTFLLHIIAGTLYVLYMLRRTSSWRRYTRSTNSITHTAYYFYLMTIVWASLYVIIYF